MTTALRSIPIFSLTPTENLNSVSPLHTQGRKLLRIHNTDHRRYWNLTRLFHNESTLAKIFRVKLTAASVCASFNQCSNVETGIDNRSAASFWLNLSSVTCLTASSRIYFFKLCLVLTVSSHTSDLSLTKHWCPFFPAYLKQFLTGAVNHRLLKHQIHQCSFIRCHSD